MAAVLVNGVNYSWTNLNNLVLSTLVIGIKSINYGIKQEKANNYGWGQEPISRGYGNKAYEGRITVYKEQWQQFVNAAANKDPLSIPAFNWTISFGGPSVPTITETLEAFEFLEDNLNANQGDTSLMIDIPFIFAGITRK